MGYLFCAKCAQRRWDDEQTYEDEMTLLTKGPLVAENCLCDSCNAAININSEACLMELMMNPELPQYSDAATYIELSEASFRLKSGKLSLKPAIVFGPPETADFNGEEHFDYVESFFRSLRGCDPNDVATILDSVIDEDDPHRSWWNILSKKVDGSFVARQLAGNEN